MYHTNKSKHGFSSPCYTVPERERERERERESGIKIEPDLIAW